MMLGGHCDTFRVLSYYIPQPGIPVEDYKDMVDAHHARVEVEQGLRIGIYPPGQFLAQGSTVYQVFGVYGQCEYLRIVGRIPYVPTPKCQARRVWDDIQGVYAGRVVEAASDESTPAE